MTKGLPHKIIALPNADKGFHESVEKLDKNKANFPHPFRVLSFGWCSKFREIDIGG